MIYRYILLEVAQQEYEDSLWWYNERSDKAAENFVKAVNDTLHVICVDPSRGRNRFEDFYEVGLRKYPFDVIYTFDDKEQLVVVHSIYHHKRNPANRYPK